MNSDAFFKAHEFHGNLSLIMVHGNHTVIAAFCSNGANKCCICWKRTIRRKASLIG